VGIWIIISMQEPTSLLHTFGQLRIFMIVLCDSSLYP